MVQLQLTVVRVSNDPTQTYECFISGVSVIPSSYESDLPYSNNEDYDTTVPLTEARNYMIQGQLESCSSSIWLAYPIISYPRWKNILASRTCCSGVYPDVCLTRLNPFLFWNPPTINGQKVIDTGPKRERYSLLLRLLHHSMRHSGSVQPRTGRRRPLR